MSMQYWGSFPKKEKLLERETGGNVPDVNAHLHTPYSFSAFEDISQALNMAKKEGVKILGINDFYSTDGHAEWATECKKRNIFPLFNIEFISLNKEDQANGIRVNDPNNPGRTYLSGKGLSYPSILQEPYLSEIKSVRNESNIQVEKMCAKLNKLLHTINAGFSLSFSEIFDLYTKGLVRERHLAKVLRIKVFENYKNPQEQITIFEKLFDGKQLNSSLNDFASLENEIRGNLLKAGGAAFVAEDPKAFLDMENVRQIIINAGGIPTYPLLADDKNGNYTEFEKDKEKLAKVLKNRGIYSVEFISLRNSLEKLEEYAGYFFDQGFVVTFGSEHNSPDLLPIKLSCRGNIPLSEKLKEINYKGACAIAAHQYLKATESTGIINDSGIPVTDNLEDFIKLGSSLIDYVIGNKDIN